MSAEDRALHDRLVARTVELGGKHEVCPLCASAETEGTVALTEEQIQAQIAAAVQAQLAAAVQAALAPANTRIAELEAQVGQTESAAAVAAAVDPLNTRVAELESQLAASQLAATAAEQARAALETQITTEAAARTEAEAATARLDTRVAAVRAAVTTLATDEWVASNQARWAALDDEAFTAELAAHTALAASLPPGTVPTTAPPSTPSAMTASAGPDPRDTGKATEPEEDLVAAMRAMRSGARN